MNPAKPLFLGRWALLITILPYTLILTTAAGNAGPLAASALAAALLYYFAAIDLKFASSSRQLRFALSRSRDAADPVLLDRARVIFATIAALLTLLLLFSSAWLGLALLVGLTVILVLDLTSSRWPLRLIEIDIPAVALVLPLTVVSLTNDSLPTAAGLAALLGALLLAVYVLACLVRDEQLDRGEQRASTATLLTPAGAAAVLFAFAAVATVIAAAGAHNGAWSWAVTPITAIASMAVLYTAASGAQALAVILAFVGAATTAIATAATISL